MGPIAKMCFLYIAINLILFFSCLFQLNVFVLQFFQPLGSFRLRSSVFDGLPSLNEHLFFHE